MEEAGNSRKDMDNNHIESVKYKDPEYLKIHNGPFTTVREVKDFDGETLECLGKNKLL